MHFILVFKNMLTFFHENLKMQNFDENPEIRKIYWMNQGMLLSTSYRQQQEVSNAFIKSENDLHLIFQNYVDIFS